MDMLVKCSPVDNFNGLTPLEVRRRRRLPTRPVRDFISNGASRTSNGVYNMGR